jgi:hypothetical protein
MKTTIDISDPLLRQAKKLAARDGVTLKTLVERGLRKIVAEDEAPKSKPFKLRDGSFKGGKGLHPDVEGLSWREILEISYGHRSVDRRR